ncbi:hypothetical protein [Streptacidiphilus cavernicola]|uniref:Uncharacterized protein n=1 Tax=Streptacidiphilus cavernicola TaxID=3342716 RepID=A0ABV6W455_9ACTN
MAGRKTGITPVRNVRVPDGLWHAAQAKAAEEGVTLTEVILAALHRYTSTPAKPSPPPE